MELFMFSSDEHATRVLWAMFYPRPLMSFVQIKLYGMKNVMNIELSELTILFSYNI